MFPSPVPHRVAIHRFGADEETRDLRRTMAGARAGSVHSVMRAAWTSVCTRILSHRWLSAARAAFVFRLGVDSTLPNETAATEVVAGSIVRRYWGRWIRVAGSALSLP